MKNIVYLILAILPLCTSAQSLSIGELWENLGIDLSQQQDQIQVQIRRAELDELRQSRIPVFYVDANVQRNLIVPTTPVPAIAFDPSAEEGAIIPLKFSTKWASKAGAQVEWSIFDPKRRSNEEEQLLQVRKAETQMESNAQDRKRDATLAYTSVVLATLQYMQAQKDSALYAEVVKVSELRYKAGREYSSAYLSAQQEMERKRIQLHEAWSILLDADLELRKFIDLSGTLVLTTDIEGIQQHVEREKSENYRVKLLKVDRQIADMRQEQMRRQLLPTLSLNAYLGGQYYTNELRLDQGEDWFGNSFVNLALRIPISAYFSSRPSLRQARLSSAMYGKQIQEEERNHAIHQQQLAVKIQTAKQKIESLRLIGQLAKQDMEEQKAAYLDGRVLLHVYKQKIIENHKAIQDIWQAQYDLITLLME